VQTLSHRSRLSIDQGRQSTDPERKSNIQQKVLLWRPSLFAAVRGEKPLQGLTGSKTKG
jgi:hypothetical protein